MTDFEKLLEEKRKQISQMSNKQLIDGFSQISQRITWNDETKATHMVAREEILKRMKEGSGEG